MAMNAPLLSTQMPQTAPALKPSALAQPPLRLWKGLSESAKRQLAATIAEMVKRMASGAREDRSDAGDHDHS